jgi:hypothetical protein
MPRRVRNLGAESLALGRSELNAPLARRFSAKRVSGKMRPRYNAIARDGSVAVHPNGGPSWVASTKRADTEKVLGEK